MLLVAKKQNLRHHVSKHLSRGDMNKDIGLFFPKSKGISAIVLTVSDPTAVRWCSDTSRKLQSDARQNRSLMYEQTTHCRCSFFNEINLLQSKSKWQFCSSPPHPCNLTIRYFRLVMLFHDSENVTRRASRWNHWRAGIAVTQSSMWCFWRCVQDRSNAVRAVKADKPEGSLSSPWPSWSLPQD